MSLYRSWVRSPYYQAEALDPLLRRIAIETDDFLSFRDLLHLPLSIACSTIKEICELSTSVIHDFDAEDEVVLLIEANADFSDRLLRVKGLHFESIAGSRALKDR